jgi:hypothetical protein
MEQDYCYARLRRVRDSERWMTGGGVFVGKVGDSLVELVDSILRKPPPSVSEAGETNPS